METVIVVGAGPAGLAVAGALKQRGVTATVLEAESEVGSAWRRHYRRLHLHTHKGGSSLPGLDFPAAFPRYPSRAQVVEYLELYQRTFGLAPSFGERVTNIEPGWKVTTSKRTLEARHVVVATGYTRVPLEPDFPGRSTFTGETLHSSRYVDGAGFAGKRVLVVGFGNSGGEIAIDLVEHGAQPTLSVRGPVNVIPRELLGLPILGVSAVMRMFPPGWPMR
ncbi:MAG: NAD(P)/FAD-dependent oxidoreductase [Archangiaceae bacterium]|nr:NAD(P)/FAD-dependent oxidoreductase [Archangiaceae bacterium]